MFGIDQQVQQRVDAYRGNPQQLQQRYAKEKDIFDLIALNQITEQQESAANQMRLAAAKKGTPPSIYEKKESQALDNAKKEVIDEQAGVMQNKMKQMQDAQKKLLQSAGAPQMPGQATPQPQEPPSAGLAGLAAPNIQGMAGGGIVAFDQGGQAGEEEARRAMEQRRQQPAPQQQTAPQSAPRGGMQSGLDALLAIRPEEIYEQRRIAAARDTNFTPEERAAKERQIQERSAADKDAELINFLLGGAGRSTNAGAIAAGGAAAQNTRNQALAARHRAEGQLIDIGPASRAAGLKAGEIAYGHAMPGLYHGVDAAARMAQTGEMAAGRAEAVAARAEAAATADERQRLQQAETRFQAARKEIYGQMDKDGVQPGSPESARYAEQINSIGQSIYGRMQVPQYFIPDPVLKPPVVPPKSPGVFDRLFGAGTPPKTPNVVPFTSLKP
jgi:hypothetical protein